jgi:glycosyltransferase involved in cell wall biosynthesis
MNILFINTFLHGGAAKGAQFLFELLKEKQDNMKFLCLDGQKENDEKYIRYKDKYWFDLFGSKKISRILRELIVPKELKKFKEKYVKNNKFSLFNHCRTTYKKIDIRGFDIIHLNWVAQFVDYSTFFKKIKKDQKVIWTLRDMNAFTGGCHHADECIQFYDGCKECPQLKLSGLEKEIERIFRIKEDALSKMSDNQLKIVCPSRWVMEQSKKSKLLGRFEHIYISHGVDISKYNLKDKDECKKRHGIDRNSKVILFVAQSLSEQRKGFDLLTKALSKVDSKNLVLVSVGNVNYEYKEELKKHSHVNLGFISDSNVMSEIYNCADVFVTPSMAESFGFTIAESLCCGTPVIAFETTAITEKIEVEKNGYLAKKGDVSDLYEKIHKSSMKGVGWMPEVISKNAKEKYSHNKMRDLYLELYKKV